MPRQTAVAEERNTERMNFRVKPRIKATIQRAAALSGVDDSVFAMSAAYEAALEIIKRHEQITLMDEDREAFFAALDGKIGHNDKLRAAFKEYDERVISRP
jgi:uncharacterized protein (DUF1778 family)